MTGERRHSFVEQCEDDRHDFQDFCHFLIEGECCGLPRDAEVHRVEEKTHAFLRDDRNWQRCAHTKVGGFECGLPPSAGVHGPSLLLADHDDSQPRGRHKTRVYRDGPEDYGSCPHGAQICPICRGEAAPLPSTEKPAEARARRVVDLIGIDRYLHDPYLYAVVSSIRAGSGLIEVLVAALVQLAAERQQRQKEVLAELMSRPGPGFVASPPPQAQPEETDDSDVELDSPNFVPPQLESLRARGFKRINNPLAQPEGEPKRIGLTFGALRAANIPRCVSGFGHALESWSPLEWAGAMCGEAGEAANVAKKMIRHRDRVAGNKGEDRDLSALREKLARELADVVIYADLCAASQGIDLGAVVIETFNRKSVEIGSDVLLTGERA